MVNLYLFTLMQHYVFIKDEKSAPFSPLCDRYDCLREAKLERLRLDRLDLTRSADDLNAMTLGYQGDALTPEPPTAIASFLYQGSIFLVRRSPEITAHGGLGL